MQTSDSVRENDSVSTYLRTKREARLEPQVNVRGTDYMHNIRSQPLEQDIKRVLTNSTETATNEDRSSNGRLSPSFVGHERTGTNLSVS